MSAAPPFQVKRQCKNSENLKCARDFDEKSISTQIITNVSRIIQKLSMTIRVQFMVIRVNLLLMVFFHPVLGIHESLHPRRDFIVLALVRIVGPLPRQEGSFKVGHHGEMAAIVGADRCRRPITAIRVARVFVLTVSHHDFVLVAVAGEVETTLAVGNPHTKATT